MIVNAILNKEGVYALSVGEIEEKERSIEQREQILEYIKVRLPNDCSQTNYVHLPDTDILILYRKQDTTREDVKWFILGIISCKVSFHARETEAAFWAVILQYHKLRMVLVTEDADRYNDDTKKRKTELAWCKKPTAVRRRLETFMDKIYVIKKYGRRQEYNLARDIDKFYSVFEEMKKRSYRSVGTKIIFDDHDVQPHCGYCNKVRPFDDLIADIMHWKFERVK
jgi:BsaWI-like restriction endonuclease